MTTTFSETERTLVAGMRVAIAAAFVSFSSLGMQPGTGGAPTAEYYRERASKGYAVAHHSDPSLIPDKAIGSSVVELLERIRSVLKPTVTELSKALKVSRQAIYAWQQGGAITAENVARVSELAKAADLFAFSGIATTNQLLRRKVGGGSFLEKVRDGASPEDAARALLVVARRENEQRMRMADRLLRRKDAEVPIEDIGVPQMIEDA